MTWRAPNLNGRPHKSAEPTPEEIFPAYDLWVEGKTRIAAGDDDRHLRSRVGALKALLSEFDLHLHMRDIDPSVNPTAVRYRKFALRNVYLGDVLFKIDEEPGKTTDELAACLYGDFQSTLDKEAKTRRLWAAIYRLNRKKPGIVLRKFTEKGVRRYFPGEGAYTFALQIHPEYDNP